MADTPPRHLPPKKEVALALLEGDGVFIHLDPRKEGVLVPKNLGKQAQLVLQVGLNLAIRIPDLNIDDDGVSCTLSFNRAPFWCRMPWSAIYALVGPDGRGMLWPEDVPPEVAAQMRAGRTAERAAKPAATKKPRPRLAAVAEEPDDAAEPPAEAGPAQAEPPRRPSKRPASRPALVPSPPEAGRARPTRAPLGAHHPPSTSGADPRTGGAARPSRPEPPIPARAPSEPRSTPGAGSPTDRAGSQGGAKKPRRELPPYLRVVK